MQGSPPALVPPSMDWDRPPWNRWAFQHMRRDPADGGGLARLRGLFGSLPRARTAISADLTLTSRRWRDARRSLRLLDETYTDGFIVAHNGAIVFERYFNGMDGRTLHLSQSVAKSVTGAAAGALDRRRACSTSTAPLTDYLPELERHGLSRRHAAACARHDERRDRSTRTIPTPIPISASPMSPRAGSPIPPGTDPGFRWPRHMFELILGLETARAPPRRSFSSTARSRRTCSPSAWSALSGMRLPQLVVG